MSIFAQSTAAPRPKNGYVQMASMLLAGILMLMVVTQLFTFEDFPDVIAAMGLPSGEFADVRAALIVVLEVASLPFLLSMRLSHLARIVSMVAGWAVVAAWTVATLWTYGKGVNGGLLGATISLTYNWWTVLFCLALTGLTAWVAWGLWPNRKAKN